MYEVYIERAAERDLRRLPSHIFASIITHVKALASDPRPPACRKIVGTSDCWRIRVGDYRVIYQVDDSVKAVRIMRARHRRDAYRP
jgi:mRNA interferase RelE/StbE